MEIGRRAFVANLGVTSPGLCVPLFCSSFIDNRTNTSRVAPSRSNTKKSCRFLAFLGLKLHDRRMGSIIRSRCRRLLRRRRRNGWCPIVEQRKSPSRPTGSGWWNLPRRISWTSLRCHPSKKNGMENCTNMGTAVKEVSTRMVWGHATVNLDRPLMR